jgi:hypothetical protein
LGYSQALGEAGDYRAADVFDVVGEDDGGLRARRRPGGLPRNAASRNQNLRG